MLFTTALLTEQRHDLRNVSLLILITQLLYCLLLYLFTTALLTEQGHDLPDEALLRQQPRPLRPVPRPLAVRHLRTKGIA